MTENASPKKKVLFLCTGNYYRSRFAEIYFNYKAINTNWGAFSRGLNLNQGNYGEISPVAVRELAKLGIPVEKQPYPQKAEIKDLENADLIICMNKNEHKKMMEKEFPQFTENVLYWDIADIFEEESSSAVPKIIHNIDRLVEQLNLYSDSCLRQE
jgi:protein-tyrosine phosphatase